MKIYTKTGDGGETSLHGGLRVPKDALRIETYGTVDELNSLLGLCRSLNSIEEIDLILSEIQNDLFTLGADLATPPKLGEDKVRRVTPAHAARLERHIDAVDSTLAPLTRFIIPGGSRTAAAMHFARTICRRAERHAARLAREESIGPDILIYLNRLSDLLFVLARRINALSHIDETPWNPA
jgi:cob(I)alamin adenosyltransferase